MAINNNLNDFFTDIADAIRSKQTYSAADFRADVQKDFCAIPMSDNFANQVLNKWKENPTWTLLIYDNSKYSSSGYVYFILVSSYTLVEGVSCTLAAPYYSCYIQRSQFESAWGEVTSAYTVDLTSRAYKNFGHYEDHVGVRTNLQTATTPEGWIERMRLDSGITLSTEQAEYLSGRCSASGMTCYPVWCTYDNDTKICIYLVPVNNDNEYGHIFDTLSGYCAVNINRSKITYGYRALYNIDSNKIIQGEPISIGTTMYGVPEDDISNEGTGYSRTVLTTKICPRDFATIILNL